MANMPRDEEIHRVQRMKGKQLHTGASVLLLGFADRGRMQEKHEETDRAREG